MADSIEIFEGLIVLVALLGVYFVPFITAYDRKLVNRWSIFMINLFFGWTLLGWVICLSWAVAGTAKVRA